MLIKSHNLLSNRGIQNILEATHAEKSEGVAVYLMAEDDADMLKNANKKLDRLLQGFWVCFIWLGCIFEYSSMIIYRLKII